MRVVADAGVALKWFLPAKRSDDDGNEALALLSGFRNNESPLLEPPHWLAEVAAVLSRVSPSTVEDDIALLAAMRTPVMDSVGSISLLRDSEIIPNTGWRL